MIDTKLKDFLLQTCKKKRLSLRSLSLNSGLSSGTVHSIVNRRYQPTLSTLNRLADYLNVKREYLWQLAGLLNDVDYEFADSRLKFYFLQADKLPESERELIVDIMQTIIAHYAKGTM